MSSSSSSTSSSGSYKPPEWAVKPQSSSTSSSSTPSPSPPTGWTLTEIKNGMEVGRYDLQSRSCWVIGRATDLVDIPSLHESLSRQHARIAFDTHGIPWLKDLKSTHGTKVNKRPLPPAACSSKQETNSTTPGSRGVQLFPGDVLQFGASTRLYLLDGGPPEYERGAVQAAQKEQQQQMKQKQQQQQQESSIHNDGNDRTSGGSGGAMWGISMDDDDDDDYDHDDDGLDDRSNKTLPMDVQVPEKYQKSLEKLNALKYKLSNLQTEDDRIRRKGELTEGQQRQLQKNSERELALRRQIVEQEGVLYDKIYPNSNNDDDRKKKNSRQKSKNNNDFVDDVEDEDDEYFDRTKKSKSREDTDGTIHLSTSIGEDEAESEQSLISKWKKLYEDLNKKRNFDMPRAASKLTSLQQHLNRLEDDGDEEAFFVKNDVDLAKESLDKVQAAIRTLQKALGDAEKLLKIVNHKIQCDRDTGYIGVGPPPPSTTSTTAAAAADANHESMLPLNTTTTAMLPPLPPQGRKDKTIQQASRTLIAGGTTVPLPPSSDLGSNSNSSSGGFVMPPPPKKKRVLGPTMPPPSYRPSSNGDDFTKPTPGPTPGPTPAPNVYPSRTGTSSHGDKNNCQGIHSESTPSTQPPLNHELSSTVLAGTALGRSLKRALLKLQKEDDEEIHDGTTGTDGTPTTIAVRKDGPPNEELHNNDIGGIAAAFECGTGSPIQQVDQPKRICTDDYAATAILKAFCTSAGSTPNETKNTAPRALIRGRCDYYNRFGPNWSIVMDQVELKRRPFPSEMKRRKHLRKHRESIWDRDTGDSRKADGATSEGSLNIKRGGRIEKVQLLAYGDMD